MLIISENELLAALNAEKAFTTTFGDGAFELCIREYVPYVCTAIHAGHRLRSQLVDNCLINEKNRFLEEDPFTDQLIKSFPITIIAKDSRFEYDLNRDMSSCIYEEAWGHKTWKNPLTDAERFVSLEKHKLYYSILEKILSLLEKKFGGCFLLDLHSYNWQVRKLKNAPVFNIGTKQINMSRFKNTVSTLARSLSKIELPNLDVEAKYDIVFKGEGYQATFVRQHFPNTLIIPLEIKKIFMDENNEELFPLVLAKLQEELYSAVLTTAADFNKRLTQSKLTRYDLLSSNIEPIVTLVDKQLFKMSKNFETLNYVNPINLQQEKRKFLSRHDYSPQFHYRQLRIDPYDFKEKLYALPVSKIQDPSMRSLYRSIVDNYAIKIEMLANIGTDQFIYNSLRYYGEPSLADIANAKFILHAKNIPNKGESEHNITAEEAKLIFEQSAKDMDLDCRVILSNRIIAKAMVDNSRGVLLVNKYFKFSTLEINALVHHELGVHMTTTLNAHTQPLNVLRLGLPGNTYTQEGLAILSEYLSGNINVNRLKQLSLRVLAVDMMLKGKTFGIVFNRLIEDYQVSIDESFAITTRVFRGGGFTKDYLYLKGFKDLVSLYNSNNISPLMIGKTGIQFYETLKSLIERKILKQPKYMMPMLTRKIELDNHVINYLVSSIK